RIGGGGNPLPHVGEGWGGGSCSAKSKHQRFQLPRTLLHPILSGLPSPCPDASFCRWKAILSQAMVPAMTEGQDNRDTWFGDGRVGRERKTILVGEVFS